MNNSTVIMGYFEREPYCHRKNDNTVTGIEVSLIKIIANAINITIHPLEIKLNNNSTKAGEIVNTFENNTKSIDFIIGGVIWRPNESTDFVLPYEVVRYVFLVPVEVQLSLGGLVSPLNNKVWLAIGCTFLFAMCLRLLLFKKISFLEILAIVIGTAWYKQPKKLSYRIKFMSWIIFGYILSQFYLASMAGKLMSRSVDKIDTFEDLVMSNKAVGGTKRSAMFFDRVKGTSEKFDNLSKILLKRFLGFDREIHARKVQDLINGRNRQIAMMALMNTTSSSPKYDPSILRILPEILSSFPLAFATWRGLPDLPQIDQKLQWIKQGGIDIYLGHRAAPRHQFEQKFNDEEEEFVQNNFIKINDLIPVFLCLIFAHTVSLVCFICELIVSRFVKSKKKQQVKRKKIKQSRKVNRQTVFD